MLENILRVDTRSSVNGNGWCSGYDANTNADTNDDETPMNYEKPLIVYDIILDSRTKFFSSICGHFSCVLSIGINRSEQSFSRFILFFIIRVIVFI